MFNASLRQLSNQLVGKKISSTELTKEFLNRIQQFNSRYNAFITVNEEMSLAQAQAADKIFASGLAGPPNRNTYCPERYFLY